MRNLLLLDLDRVLFDTDTLLGATGDKESLGVFTLEKAKTVNWKKVSPEKLLYPEVKKVLLTLEKLDWELVLWSEGEIAGQLFKIKYTGLGKIFPKKKRLLFDDKAKHFNDIWEKFGTDWSNCWLVDDKPAVLQLAKRLKPAIKTVLMCRGPWWKIKVAGFKPDHKISNLRELLKLIS